MTSSLSLAARWALTTLLMIATPGIAGAADALFPAVRVIDFSNLESPQFTVPTDLDGDGDTDLIYVTRQEIRTVENLDGQGQRWGAPGLVAGISGVRSVEPVDLDGDGLIDILWSRAGEGTVKAGWLENLGAGAGFASSEVIATHTQGAGFNEESGAVAADFDGDGQLDVAIVSAQDETVTWLRNEGRAASFSPPTVVQGDLPGVPWAPWQHATLAAGDVDVDGDIDLVWHLHRHGVWWGENIDGQGVFAVQEVPGFFQYGSIQIMDVDGDRDLDILKFYGHSVSLCEYREEQGDFFPAWTTSFEWGKHTVVGFDDVDGDEDRDIIVSVGVPATEEPYVLWFENRDHFDSLGPALRLFQAPGSYPDVTSADIDGDGDTDWITATEAALRWFEHQPSEGDLATPHTVSLHNFWAWEVRALDLDGDGDLDPVVRSANPGGYFIYENLSGLGGFAARRRVATGNDSRGFHPVLTADIDGDGDLDLASASHRDFGAVWFERTLPTGFSYAMRPLPAFYSLERIFLDLDEDGDLDLISLRGETLITWIENLGPEQGFAEPIFVGRREMHLRGVTAVDLNGDGHVDLLPTVFDADETEGPVGWYENATDQVWFHTFHPIHGGFVSGLVHLEPLDLDGDGDLDVIAWGETVGWFEWNGETGAFAPHEVIDPLGASTLRAGDLDADGLPDLVYGRGSEMIARLRTREGYSEPQPLAAPGAPREIIIADVNLDGAPDIVASFENEQALAWFEQTDEASFSPARPLLGSEMSGPPVTDQLLFTLGDLDGDADPDILVADPPNSLVLWLENATNSPAFPHGLHLMGD